jgi:hypothetical protein
MTEWLRILTESIAAEYADRAPVAALATTDGGGKPHVRHVVCRRIDPDGSILVTSDARSHKNQHIRANPNVELSFWLPSRREQFRIAGTMIIEIDATIWQSLPIATRAIFFWPFPGQPKASRETFTTPDSDSAPPPNFEVLRLIPLEVDHLQLFFDPHRRRRWRRETEWLVEELNP